MKYIINYIITPNFNIYKVIMMYILSELCYLCILSVLLRKRTRA